MQKNLAIVLFFNNFDGKRFTLVNFFEIVIVTFYFIN